MELASYARGFMKKLILLFSVAGLVGCSTTAKYEAKLPGGPAKPEEYPIYIYTQDMKLPRSFEVMGTMKVSDTPFTVTGGALEDVLKKLRQKAREQGADALQMRKIREPGFVSANYGAEADFLRFTDTWESIPATEEQIRAYFQTNAAALDPIEGIWMGNDPMQSRLAIVKNTSKPKREFVAIILSSRNKSWQPGDKKLDLARGERPGVYRGVYHLEDYRPWQVAFALRGTPANRFFLQMPDEATPVFYSRE